MSEALVLLSAELRLDTRRRSHIANHLSRVALTDGTVAHSEFLKQKHRDARPRPTEPTAIYNCHGLTFGSRRTGITSPALVRKLLAEDDYVRVDFANLSVGDIAIYVEDGDISHSGVVVEIARTALGIVVPWVMSKWGDACEFIHRVHDCPYPTTEIEYYRIVK